MCTRCHLTQTDQVPVLEIKFDRFWRVIVGVFVLVTDFYTEDKNVPLWYKYLFLLWGCTSALHCMHPLSHKTALAIHMPPVITSSTWKVCKSMSFLHTVRVYAESGKVAIKSSKYFTPKYFLALKILLRNVHRTLLCRKQNENDLAEPLAQITDVAAEEEIYVPSLKNGVRDQLLPWERREREMYCLPFSSSFFFAKWLMHYYSEFIV